MVVEPPEAPSGLHVCEHTLYAMAQSGRPFHSLMNPAESHLSHGPNISPV